MFVCGIPLGSSCALTWNMCIASSSLSSFLRVDSWPVTGLIAIGQSLSSMEYLEKEIERVWTEIHIDNQSRFLCEGHTTVTSNCSLVPKTQHPTVCSCWLCQGLWLWPFLCCLPSFPPSHWNCTWAWRRPGARPHQSPWCLPVSLIHLKRFNRILMSNFNIFSL